MSEPARTVEQTQFRISYDGPALATGRMDIRELAPAMLAVGNLVEHSAGLVYGATATIKIEVQANFREGSFSYEVVASGVELAQSLLSNLSVSDLIALLGLTTGGTGLSVFGLIKWLRKRSIARVEQEKNQTRITTADGDSVTAPTLVYTLTQNLTVRLDAYGVVQPLRQPGITTFLAGRPGQVSTVVEREDLEYFDPPVPGERVLDDSERETFVEVVAPTFRPGQKWRFAQGDSTFFATVLDTDFLAKVARRDLVFGTGDVLRVVMRQRFSQSADGTSVLREVVRVLDYIPAPQLDLLSPTAESET